MTGSRLLDPVRQNTLRALADIIVPRSATMPSASDLGLCDEPVDHVLHHRADLLSKLQELLDRVSDLPAEAAIPWLADHEPAFFAVLMQVVAGAYYSHPVVWQLLGYTGQQSIPLHEHDPF